jgi:hypothetical protein
MFIEPENLFRSGDDKTLQTSQIAQWRNEGYLLIADLFPDIMITNAINEIQDLQMKNKNVDDFQVGEGITFPTGMQSLDSLTLAPSLITAVKQLLDATEIRLSQAETWKKVAYNQDQGDFDRTYSNQDQRMHMDYPNHTLLHPPEWNNPEAVACIIYLSDSILCGGATNVVPRSGPEDPIYVWPYSNMPGFGDIPWANDRSTVESYLEEHHPDVASFRTSLYERERAVTFKPGTVLFYRHDIWHRGTPLKAGATRYVQNLVFKRPQCDWLNNWNQGVAYSMYRRDQYVEKMIARLNVEQRNCLGIPLPGHSYWTPSTLLAVERRYAVFGMDMTPYRSNTTNSNVMNL